LSEKKSVKASADNLADYLGVPKYRYGEVEDKDLIGVVTGLAWTDVGGELSSHAWLALWRATILRLRLATHCRDPETIRWHHARSMIM
jgi:hypothetical protein